MNEKHELLEREEMPSGREAPPPPYAESSSPAYLASQESHTIAYPPQTILPPEQRPHKPPKDYYTLSLLLSLLYCLVFAPYLLICTIPALRKSKEGRRAAESGDYITAKKKAKEALNYNIASILIGLALLMVFFTVVFPVAVGITVPLVLFHVLQSSNKL